MTPSNQQSAVGLGVQSRPDRVTLALNGAVGVRSSTAASRGFSLIELLIVVAVISIIGSISVPNLVQSKKAANEASAIASMRTLATAEIAYASTVGSGQFGTMSNLSQVGLIDSELASGSKEGYNFAVVPNGSNGFAVTGVPSTPGLTGTRGFYTDATGVIRFSSDGSAPDENSSYLGIGSTGGWGVIKDPGN